WYLFQACTFGGEGQAVWGAAHYQEEYVRVGGEWKFRQLTVTSSFWTPYEQGWVKQPFLQQGG
ncbi:MAG: nuclear transport factor 2 family protein, partial [Candidatus Tectomicrobia bacterium]|nr:nuclear transport factor 2 family protein [Candidatus Tectomicrobia bacterium]